MNDFREVPGTFLVNKLPVIHAPKPPILGSLSLVSPRIGGLGGPSTHGSKLTLSKLTKGLIKFMAFASIGMVLLAAAPAMAQDAGESVGFFQGLQNQLVSTLAWIQSLGLWAPIVFVLLYIVITVAFLPASIVTLGAGFIFGVVQGSFLVFIAAMLGATAAFLIGRYVARDWIAQKIAGNKKFAAIDDAIAKEGRKLVFLIRLSPAFPFNLLNYALGLTQVSLTDYILGTTGILPGTIMYVYLGSLVKDLATLGTGDVPSNPVIDWAIKILIFVTVVAITVYITRIARKALQGVSDEGMPAES